MIDLYTVIVFITIIVLIITMVDAFTASLITKTMKRRSIIVCLLIGGSILCEWIGVKTNGADASLIVLHKDAKLLEFCLSPAIGISASMAYGKVRKPKIMIGFVIAHILFECLALQYGLVFSIDEANIYHRESLYWVYIAAFSLSTIYCFVSIVQGGKEYQAKMDSVLTLILNLLAIGIGIQMMYSEIRVDFMCVALGNLMLYNHHCKVVLQVDMITRLLNRRCYEIKIKHITSPAIILIFDINKFKKVNDTYGHEAGDFCLKKVGEQLRAVYGKYGYCYRIGGDEFCVIMTKNLDNMENLNRQFEYAIKELCEHNEKISDVSYGYAYYSSDSVSIHNVVKQADNMMYKNKTRNLCSTAD